MPGVVVDIGTGDGRFIYEQAKAHPDRLFIGIDPNHGNLQKISLKAAAKREKGGLENVYFVLGSIEALPTELNHRVNQVFINLPWAGLLEKVIKVEPTAWGTIARICQSGAFIDVLIGYDEVQEAGVKDRLNLPEIFSDHIAVMAIKLEGVGFELVESEEVDATVLKDYPSSWAKKLLYSKDRKFYFLRIKKL